MGGRMGARALAAARTATVITQMTGRGSWAACLISGYLPPPPAGQARRRRRSDGRPTPEISRRRATHHFSYSPDWCNLFNRTRLRHQ